MKVGKQSLRHGIWVACLALSACGGGGGGGSGAQSQSTAALAQQCSANNPYRADARSATTAGTLGTEKSWVRAYFDEAYLWYGEVPVVDAAAPAYSNDTATGFYTSIDGYFEALKVTSRDRFSFTYPTKAWDTLFQSGQMVGDGIQWHYDSPKPPRNMRVVFVEPASPAASAGVQRGDTLVSVNGVSADDATTAGVATGFTVSSPGDYYIQVRTNLNAASSGMTNVNPDGLILKPTDGGGTSSNPIAYPTASLLNVGTMGHNIFAMRIATSTSGPTSAGDDVSLSAQNRLPIYANQVGAQNVNLIQVPENARGSTFDFSFFDVTDYSGNATLRVLGPGDVAWSGCSIAGGLTGTFNASTCTITMPGGTNNNQGRTGTMTVPIPTGYECTSFGTPAPRECWFRVAFTIGSGANEDTTWSANLNGDPVRLVQ